MNKLSLKFIFYCLCILVVMIVLGLVLSALGGQKIVQVTANQILFPTLDQNSNCLLYFSNEKEAAFYQMDLASHSVERISEIMDTPDDVFWSPDKQKAILKVIYHKDIFEKYGSLFKDYSLADQTITFWLYDFTTKELQRLGLNIISLNWDVMAKKIVYIYQNPDSSQREIYISDPDGSNQKKVIDALMNYYRLFYYNSENQFLIFAVNVGTEEVINQKVYTLNQEGNLKEIVPEAQSGSIFVSDDGRKLTYLQNQSLYWFDLGSGKITLFDKKIKRTLASWMTDIQLIVFEPPEKATSDLIYLVNTQTKEKKRLKYKGATIEAQTVMISPDNKTLYFTSNDILYKLEIK